MKTKRVKRANGMKVVRNERTSLHSMQRRCRSRCSEYRDFFLESASQCIALLFQVEARLQIQPKIIGRTEVASQAKRCVCGDSTLAMNDLVDSAWRHADVERESILRNPKRPEKILEQYLAWVDGGQFARSHSSYLMIVDNLHIIRVAVTPTEAHAPLVIDPNAVLSLTVSIEFLQPIARW
jgi:hypothetical protein